MSERIHFDRLCGHCGTSFKPGAADQRFCSQPCFYANRRKTISKSLITSNVVIDPRTGCWNWVRGLNNGYGNISYMHVNRLAHRVSFELFNGPIPDGRFVCHKCDNPKCCNPDHLFAGTSEENTKDRHAKGRSAKGSGAGPAKMTEQIVSEARTRYAAGENCASLAREYGISKTSMNYAICGRTWKHVGVSCPTMRSEPPPVLLGEQNRFCRLSDNDIREIRRLASSGITQVAIAKQFNMRQGAISTIVLRKSRKNI